MKGSGIRPFLAPLWAHVLTLSPPLSMTYRLKRLEPGIYPPDCRDVLEGGVTAVNKPEVWFS